MHRRHVLLPHSVSIVDSACYLTCHVTTVQLKNRNGSSRQALKKYVKANNAHLKDVQDSMFDSLFNRALKNGVDKGVFEQPKGPSGGTKLAKPAAAAAKKDATKKEAAPKKEGEEKKPAAKKATTAKKPAAKKAAPKKEAAKKEDTKKAAPKKAAPKKAAPKKAAAPKEKKADVSRRHHPGHSVFP